MPKSLGQVIQEYRNKNKLSMRKFAEYAQTTPAYISMIESGKRNAKGEIITPSFEMMTNFASAMGTDVVSLMAMIGIEGNREKAEEAGLVQRPSLALSGGDEIQPFKHVPLTQKNLDDALAEGRLLITPFPVPKKGMLLYVPNLEMDMVIPYEVIDVQGGVYMASHSMGQIEFTLFDIDRLIFYERNKATEMLKLMKSEKPADKKKRVQVRKAYFSEKSGRSWGNAYGESFYERNHGTNDERG